jgi:hypothetical protein
MTRVLVAKFVGAAANKPAFATVCICAVSADAKTSALAPWVRLFANSEEPAKLNSSLTPGLSALNRWPIWVNTCLSEAAANTTTDLESWPDGAVELHAVRLPTSSIGNQLVTKPVRRIDQT